MTKHVHVACVRVPAHEGNDARRTEAPRRRASIAGAAPSAGTTRQPDRVRGEPASVTVHLAWTFSAHSCRHTHHYTYYGINSYVGSSSLRTREWNGRQQTDAPPLDASRRDGSEAEGVGVSRSLHLHTRAYISFLLFQNYSCRPSVLNLDIGI